MFWLSDTRLISRVLQEEAFLAPDKAIRKQLGKDYWVWGEGFSSLPKRWQAGRTLGGVNALSGAWGTVQHDFSGL